MGPYVLEYSIFKFFLNLKHRVFNDLKFLPRLTFKAWNFNFSSNLALKSFATKGPHSFDHIFFLKFFLVKIRIYANLYTNSI